MGKLKRSTAKLVFCAIEALHAAVRYIDADAKLDCHLAMNPEMILANGHGSITVYNGRGWLVGRLDYQLPNGPSGPLSPATELSSPTIEAAGWQTVRERARILEALANCAQSIEEYAS